MKKLKAYLHLCYLHIFTLIDNFLRWTCFGPMSFIHPWTTLAHATFTDIWSSWLVDVTFDWWHVMVSAVERNNQTRQLLTFLRSLLCINLIKTSQILNKNDVKTKYKYKRWIPFFWGLWKYERNRSHAKLTCDALRVLLCMWPIVFILPRTSEKWNLFLKWQRQILSWYGPCIHFRPKTHMCGSSRHYLEFCLSFKHFIVKRE